MKTIGKTKSIKLLAKTTVLALLTLPTIAATAQGETAEQRKACAPDVIKLCRQSIPDREAITECLAANIERLSPDCHAVMASRQ